MRRLECMPNSCNSANGRSLALSVWDSVSPFLGQLLFALYFHSIRKSSQNYWEFLQKLPKRLGVFAEAPKKSGSFCRSSQKVWEFLHKLGSCFEKVQHYSRRPPPAGLGT